MKSPLSKLRGFTLSKRSSKENRDANCYAGEPLAEFDELKKAMQDIQDMRECYEELLSASAVTTNSAYEFSQALQDMATCLLEKTALNIDEESARLLRMLGKVQHELHKIFDHYRAHISQTITTPSESLLTELQNVEVLKSQCDEKRKVYDHIRTQSAKGKSKSGKAGALLAQQLKLTKEEYDDQATFLVCRLMSLKQGQSRSLLTQTARHHTAQLQLFRKGLASLEALEPHVKQIAEEQRIDHQLSELDEDDCGVSLDFTQINCDLDESASSENSMKISTEKIQEFRHSTSVVGSKSAPISPYACRTGDGIDKIQEIHLEASANKNVHTYALPTPVGGRSTRVTGGTNNSAIGMKLSGGGGAVNFQWNTSPLEQCNASAKSDTNLCNSENSISGPLMRQSNIVKGQSVSEESTTRTRARPMPLPSSVEKVPLLRSDGPVLSDVKRIKRHSHSGPLIGKSCSSKSVVCSSGPLPSLQVEPLSESGPVSRCPKSCTYASPKMSPSLSPSHLSPPRISELHELPRPPSDLGQPLKPTSSLAHSAPLVARRSQEPSTVKMPGKTISKPASPLPPPPPGLVTRSLSIPSFGQRGQSQQIRITEEVSSPPLKPIPFPTGNVTSLCAKAADLDKNPR
eukprot:Gb_17844 [translate_table: standard]